ncbi:fimbrial protein [Pantoea stewartii subsp. indologenes]|uniref:fimbrial protein n=1 Tax=Pantoea stewartii TaxID=66269 RepID=UPI00050E53F1|nr:fimbrial protein [Pantoea stewartii]KGD84319.1 fimbrial protein [Pantoea stewartii subsp. indologenes]
MFKKTLLTGIIALTTLSGSSVFAAQENSIRFRGEVSAQTCNISVNDSTSAAPIILMQTAKADDLDTAGKTSSPTTFSMKLTGCSDPGTPGQDIKIHFASNNVDTSGNLKNIATSSPAQNVAIQLLDPDNNFIDLTSGEADSKAFTLNAGVTSGEAQYTARYIATGGAATAGKVEATVQYAVSYL